MRPEVREAAEIVIGNLNEDGYLIASDDELMGVVPPAPPEADAAAAQSVVKEAAALGLAAAEAEVDLVETDGAEFSPSAWTGSNPTVVGEASVGAATALAATPGFTTEPVRDTSVPAPKPLPEPVPPLLLRPPPLSSPPLFRALASRICTKRLK